MASPPPPPSPPHHLPLPMASPSRPSNGAENDIIGDRAEPRGDASSTLSPNLPMPSSAPAPPPPSRGIAGDEAEPCVAAPFPISAMASSAPAPPPPPLLLPVRKTRRLTSAVWRDAKPIYRRNILVKAQCNRIRWRWDGGAAVLVLQVCCLQIGLRRWSAGSSSFRRPRGAVARRRGRTSLLGRLQRKPERRLRTMDRMIVLLVGVAGRARVQRAMGRSCAVGIWVLAPRSGGCGGGRRVRGGGGRHVLEWVVARMCSSVLPESWGGGPRLQMRRPGRMSRARRGR